MLTRLKPHYGWIVAVAGAISVLATSNFQYTFGVFVRPLTDTFSWSRSAVSGIASLRSVFFGSVSPVAGSLCDRYGPRKLVLAGVILSGAGYILGSRITELWQAYLFLGMMTGIATGLGYPPVLTTVTRWFGGRASAANGIVLSGFGLAQIMLPPLATYLITTSSWSFCFLMLGCGVLVIGTVAWLFIRRAPAAVPASLPGPAAGPQRAGAHAAPAGPALSLAQAVHTRAFGTLFALYILYAMCFQFLTVHIVAAAMDAGVTAEPAALVLTLIGVTNTVARLGIGWTTGRFSERHLLIASLGLQVPMFFLLMMVRQPPALYAVALVYGLAYGCLAPMVPTLVRDIFGTKSLGGIFGTMNSAYSAGMALGPYLGGYIFDTTHSYEIAFASAGVAMAIAFALSLTIKYPAERRRVPASTPPA